MAISAHRLTSHIKAAIFHAIRSTYRSTRDYPFLAGTLFSLLLLYRCFPSLFTFLVSSSPVIAITTLLLGILLSYGDPKLPEIEEDAPTHQVSSLAAASPADDLVVKDDHATLAVEAHLHSTTSPEDKGEFLTEREVLEDGFLETREFSAAAHEDEFLKEREVLEDGFLATREFPTPAHKDEFLEERMVVDNVGGWDGLEMKGLEVRIGRPKSEEENRFDSSLGSPWQPVDVQGSASSDSSSDRAESSSPDASMADILPMLDELHPLLDLDAPEPPLKSMDSWDAASAVSSEDHESEDGEKDEEHLEEEEEKAEEAVKWSADDEKNVMDLGISDIERNRRLESLIAKRRARRDLRFLNERNLIDFDSVTGMDELSRYQVRIPPISATRRNPFDLSYEEDGPGSAPSVLQPRHNPFDLLYDDVGESSSLTTDNLSLEESQPVPRQDMFLRKHGSFNWVATFSEGLKRERRGSKLNPYFSAEGAESTGFASLQRQFSEKSDSKISSVPDSDMSSSDVDEEQLEEVTEEEFGQDRDMEHVEKESASSEEIDSEDVDSDDADCVRSAITIGDVHGIDLNALMVAEETRLAVEDEVREKKLDFSILVASNSELAQDKSVEFGSSSEVYEKSTQTSTFEELIELEKRRGDSSEGSGGFMHSISAYSTSGTSLQGGVDGSQIANPVYDLSPSTSFARSNSNASTLDEPSIVAGHEVSPSSALFPSNRKGDVLEVASTPKPLEEHISSSVELESVIVTMDKDLASASDGLQIATSDSSLVDENYSELIESTEAREHMDILDGLSSDHGDLFQSIAVELPSSEATLHTSSLSSVETESCDVVDATATIQSKELEVMGAETYPDRLVSSNHLTPIPEENVEGFEFSEESESRMDAPGVLGLTGLRMIEDPNVEFCEIEQELSHFRKMSTVGSDDTVDTTRQIYASGLTGLSLLEPMESLESPSPLDTVYDLEVNAHSTSSDLDNLDEEPDQAHANVIDADLLAELDVVGDFLSEVRSGQGAPKEKSQSGSQFIDDSSDSVFCSEKQDIPRSIEVNFTGLDDLHAVMSESEDMESQIGSSSKHFGIDTEMTVYNPKHHVLDACSTEELDSAIKQLREDSMVSLYPELDIDVSQTAEHVSGSDQWDADDPKLLEADSKLHVLEASSFEELQSALKQVQEGALKPSGLKITGKSVKVETEVGDPELTETNSELQVLEGCSFKELDSSVPFGSEPIVEKSATAEAEGRFKEFSGEPELPMANSELQVPQAKSIEDITSGFKELSQTINEKSVVPEVEPSDNFTVTTHLEHTGPASDVQVVEAMSHEDIHLAPKQLTDDIADISLKLAEAEVGPAVVEASNRNPVILEVQSAEEMQMAFEEVVNREASPVRDEKSSEIQTAGDVSSTSASTSGMTTKNDKSGKSDSSSSSSSGSSSSDSE